MTAAPRELVRELEGIAARAWPAPLVEPLDGWLLRFNDGFTRRANSVLPNGSGLAMPLAEKLTRVEEFYGRRRLPALYQMSPASEPPDLDAILADRGYRSMNATLVQTAPLAEVLARTVAPNKVAGVYDTATGEWVSAYCETITMSASDARGRGEVLGQLPQHAGYGSAQKGGKTVAVGLGVHEGAWLGIFSMVTQVAYRRCGLATALLNALAEWGQRRGASRVYLQVMDENAIARKLYASAGFQTLYRYHYREQERAESGGSQQP